MPTLKKFSLTGTAGNLEGIAHLPDDAPRAIAVVAHPLPTMGGTMENKVVTTLAKTFAELGCAALRFNFRGVDNSEGEFDSGNGEAEDVLARAAQHLHPQPHRLVLIAPAVGRFAMPNVPHNTLLIHGEQDEVVPLEDIMDWARPQQLPVVVLPGAEHFFHGRLNQIRQIVLREFNGQKL